jgi:hypothetical protein
MKFLIVTCLKEYSNTVFEIFKEAKIKVFSTTDVTGFKESDSENLLGDWFASGDEKFSSLMMFSFTDSVKAKVGIDLIIKYNIESATNFPIRAFILPVEAVSY